MNRLLLSNASTSLLAISIVAVAGCSSSSNSGSDAGSYGDIPAAAFSHYCTATLENAAKLMADVGGGAWLADGTATAPAGTPFLLATFLSGGSTIWRGVVFRGDGTPFEIETDFVNGLVAGTDFTSACAPTTIPLTGPDVVLADTTLFPNADFSGAACTIAAGTTLTNFSFSSQATTRATVSADEITEKCGAQTMYAAHFPFAQLVAK